MFMNSFIILLIINGIHGFTNPATYIRPFTFRELKASSTESTRKEAISSLISANTKNTVERRDVLTTTLLLISSTAALAGGKYSVPSLFSSLKTEASSVSSASTTVIRSVDEALNLIESSCNRRYLHAVIASGYKLMYRGVPSSNEARNFASVHTNEASDLLMPSTYDSKEALKFFNLLEEEMSEKPIKPSNGHLATTNSEAAKIWGGDCASVWPLGEADGDDVHFAWLEDGGEFWPSLPQGTATNVNNFAASKKVIVDGVDCGRMSLDDALENKGGKDYEIMFRSKQFLLVPSMYEEKLLSGLKSAFII